MCIYLRNVGGFGILRCDRYGGKWGVFVFSYYIHWGVQLIHAPVYHIGKGLAYCYRVIYGLNMASFRLFELS